MPNHAAGFVQPELPTLRQDDCPNAANKITELDAGRSKIKQRQISGSEIEQGSSRTEVEGSTWQLFKTHFAYTAHWLLFYR
ncbi:hypothetical protein Poly59_26460 [Rubripirellula reticaptiva]|uniref:Uncharacterized protein n=1 Tax=Rubripirellula reticaptiva TaxID=2528013 RepID=A0A5C6F5S5_9BACT|nr:hypothetical protein Poly59_26460 [Rubripirellula reticaptiva]